MIRLAALLLCGVAAFLAACTPSDHAVQGPAESPAEIRSDTAPLTTRFPVIGVPVAATWVTWNNADPRVPGPTTYWIDAVITLQPQATHALANLKPAAEGLTPAIAEQLRTAVSDGPFLTGAALNEALSTAGSTATGYLDTARNQLVIKAIED